MCLDVKETFQQTPKKINRLQIEKKNHLFNGIDSAFWHKSNFVFEIHVNKMKISINMSKTNKKCEVLYWSWCLC